MNYKELTGPQLVMQWKNLVNNNVQMARDATLFKRQLTESTPVQILLGIYQFRNNRTITIPQFLAFPNTWMVYDDSEAEIELAVKIATADPPAAYWVWKDFYDEDEIQPEYRGQFDEARKELLRWSERVLV